ncbi:MAG: hypothetical protein QF464_16920 [Myxococcota bacterium]|jgi:hypothetical protein|nr:hypothetical protein [Myxococcota bacterium]
MPTTALEEDSAWYEQWWLWTLVGAAVAGGATAAVLMTQGDGAPPGHGGTVEW